ncbi:oligosaccharide flippase family protein [Acinetobacter sp. ANC 4805]|uniref:oligosaccharide flippase family protein n=1 Tax=Acinetobacter sp. ANC 4805 TaxID=2923425 RepID=UPI001F4B075B|nr:oligosaccharide flippase family protein [Acinetobacter sp. ANC 4805]MCH7312344.1 oligosaccharide flippase family protein [Acinetobacter sp. ANC 4805]
MFKLIFSVAAVTALAQLLQLISQPLLTYLYAKESFGYLSIIVSIITFISLICNFQFNNLILISKDNINRIFNTGLVSSFILEFFCFLFLIFFSYFIFQDKRVELLILTILYVVFYCFNVLFRAVLLRQGKNKLYSVGILIRSIVVVVSQILLSYYNKSLGLVLGVVVSEFVLVLFSVVFCRNNIGFYLNLKDSISVFWENKKFLITGTIQELISTSMFISPLLLITYKFSYSVGGEFSVVHKLVWGPAFLLTQVVSPIFLQYVARDDFKEIYFFNIKNSIVFFCITASIAFYSTGFVFEFILKSDWYDAVWMSKYIVIWVLSFIMALPYRVLLRAEKKQIFQLPIDLLLLIVFMSIFIFDYSFYTYIYILTIFGTLGNFLIMFASGKIIRDRGWND